MPAIKPGANVGLISLIMVFMVLCLTVFVALALTSASTDRNLTVRTGQTVTAFYAAQNQSQAFLLELDALLLELNLDAIDATEFSAMLPQRLEPLLSDNITFDESLHLLNARWPAGERLYFETEIRVNLPGAETRYSTLSIRTVSVQESFNRPVGNLWR